MGYKNFNIYQDIPIPPQLFSPIATKKQIFSNGKQKKENYRSEATLKRIFPSNSVQ